MQNPQSNALFPGKKYEMNTALQNLYLQHGKLKGLQAL